MTTLQTIWFLLIGVLITGYAILDGFDLGIGNLHLLARTEEDKKTMINAVGPFWDGNEVWLLTGGGAIFAAFPPVYATVFSGFYLALVVLLVAIILRAVSVEFRNKVDSPGWKGFWDVCFFLGSVLPSILLGVAFGNIMRGVPIDASGEYAGTFFTLLNPFSILVGLLSLAMFTLQGSTYLAMKTEGSLREWAAGWARLSWAAYVVLFAGATAVAWFITPHLFLRPLSVVFAALAVAAMIYMRGALTKERFLAAFLGSSVSIAGIIGTAAASFFPNMVRSTIDVNYSLTAMNASSSQRTLTVMLILALVGVPIVLAYTAYIYRCFKGKVTAKDLY